MSQAAVTDQPPSGGPLAGLTLHGAVAAATFFACSSAPTPLYRLYQESLGLSPLLLTLVFAAYAFSLLAALLTLGRLSDFVGRRPMMLAALLLNALALLVFILAQSALALILARVLQGFAAGIAATTFGAAILDSDRQRGPVINSVTGFLGLTVGTLGAGALASYAAEPAPLVYGLLLGVTLLLVLLLPWLPETAARRPGALASLRPRIAVPRQARAALLEVTPVNVASWALGGFYFSLMPSVVRSASGFESALVGGLDVALLTATAATMVLLLRRRSPAVLLTLGTGSLALGVAVTLGGLLAGSTALLFLGTLVSGVGFGTTFAGVLRHVLPLAPPGERAALLAAYYVMSYIAFGLPAILAGLLVPEIGLPLTTYLYGAVVIVLALLSLLALRLRPQGAAA